MQPVGGCLVFSLWYRMVKCIITGKAQKQLAHGYVCWASDGFSHCISCAGNAVLSKVTHLHLLFLRQPKGTWRGCWKSVSDAKADFFCCCCCVFWFRFFLFSFWNSVCECGWYHIRVQKCTNRVFSFLARQSIYNPSWVSNVG